MNPLTIATKQFKPKFVIPEKIDTINSLTPLLLGQRRLLSAFDMAAAVPSQHMFMLDYSGINRQLLIQAMMQAIPNSQHCYLTGKVQRKDIIGYKDLSGKWQQGALAKEQWVFICAEALLRREGIYELVFDCLENQRITLNHQESSPLKAKIVLIGQANTYAFLCEQELRIKQFFPLLAELATEINSNQIEIEEYCCYLTAIAQHLNVELDHQALSKLLCFSSSLTEDQQKLSLLSDELLQLIEQTKRYSQTTQINQEAVAQALDARKLRHNATEKYTAHEFDIGVINLLTDGEVIGQINALTVIDTLDYCYGEPARITASIHYGDGEVVDIERKSELGGNIHAKGMMILSSCLYRIFGRDAPLPLNANIVFEQSYQEIDGDSASLAEYCCLISAIAEKPILQSFAVTGALDQLGNVQAVGGINEKIVGFYNLCQRRGLTGKQGVIIPKANRHQLNLPDELINNAKQGLFNLYQVEHMDQAVELLLQMPVGIADENNDFSNQSIYGIVQRKLKRLAGSEEDLSLSCWQSLKNKFGF